MREFQLALMQSVEACRKSQEIACFGVKPGPVSPRRAEPPPYYVAAQINGDRVVNRADGPEDFGLSERCLSGQPAKYRRRAPDCAVTWSRVDPV